MSDIKLYSRKSREAFLSPDQSYAIATASLSGRISGILPDQDWTVVAYTPINRFFSFYHPSSRKIAQIWLIVVVIIALLTYQAANRISLPFSAFISAIGSIAQGHYNSNQTKLKTIAIPELADIERNLARIMEETSLLAGKSLRESTASLQAFSDMTQEAALEYDRRIIAESLLRISIRTLNADAGLLLIHNPDYKSPMKLQFNLTDEQIEKYQSLAVHDANSKQVYFSWDHEKHEAIWQDGFQVIVSVPVRTRQSRFGTLYLLFNKVIDTDIEKDHTLELLAQQCAVYTSRSGLFHQLDQQISFTEGILSGIPWFICAIDSQMKITWHNNRREIAFFDEMENLIGTKCCFGFKGKDTICADCPVKQTIHDSQSHEVTQNWTGPSGENQWIRLNSFPLKDETGQMHSAILFIRDISAEIAAQSEIRRFSRAIDCIGEAVIITDMDGRIVFTNKAFGRIYQYSDTDVKGHYIELIFPSEDAGIHKKILTTLNRDGIWIREMDLLRRNDERVPTSLTASLVLDEKGNPIGKVVTCFDLSVRLQREKQVIRHYKELEILHKINQILVKSIDQDELLDDVLNHIGSFSGCQSGAILLYDRLSSYKQYAGKIEVDPGKPAIMSELELPGYFSNYIKECRQGRESHLLQMLSHSDNPLILNNLQTETSIDSKLIARMGFQAMLAIPIHSQTIQIGLILLFSGHSYHFSHENTDIYRSISSQLGISLHGRYLQERLLAEARFILTGEVITRIGNDVRRVVQGLEISRHLVEEAIRVRSWSGVSNEWDTMNRRIWQIYQINLNILAYDAEDQKLFFPENLNSLIRRWLKVFNGLSFTGRVAIVFEESPDMHEVYINKITVQRAFTNLLTLVLDACWAPSGSDIKIRTITPFGNRDSYAIEFDYLRQDLGNLEKLIQDYRDNQSHSATAVQTETPLLLTEADRCIRDHNGLIVTAIDNDRSILRVVLPRFPARS